MDCSDFHSPRDYLDLARSSTATPEQLRSVAGSQYDFVLLAVAQNPSTLPDVLTRLVPSAPATYNDQALLLALAEHPLSTQQTLRAVAERVPRFLHERDAQQGFGAGIALFRREDCPDEVLLGLLEDPAVTTEFRKVAARETTHPAVLNRLRHHASTRVQRTIARREAALKPAEDS